jgi:esterase
MKLHFRTFGEGPPLILLHGLLGSLGNWQPLARRFAGRFKVFAVDQRNHGLSPHSQEVSFDAMAGDLREFMQTHALAQAHMLGHSMGGKVAMQFALLHPESVARLVVVDVAPRAYPPRHAHALEALLALDLNTLRRREELDGQLAKAIPEAEARQFLLKNLRRDGAGGFHWKANVRGLLENYERLTVALTGCRPFSKPALFVRGEKSDYVGEADCDLIRRLFPLAEFCSITGAGHWVHADAPEALFCNVTEFLSR